MIEVIALMGVIAAVTMGLYATVSKIFDRYHQAAIMTQIKDLQKNIQARFATAANYSELNDAGVVSQLIEDRVIPSDMVVGDEIRNTYGGAVSLGGSQYEYTIQFSQIKQSACVDLLMMDWSVDNTSDLVKVTIGGKSYTWGGDGNAKLPVPAMEAADRCKGDQNSIEWTFQ